MAEAREAAERLYTYHSKLGTGEEVAYPDEFDPEEDARLVREALAEG